MLSSLFSSHSITSRIPGNLLVATYKLVSNIAHNNYYSIIIKFAITHQYDIKLFSTSEVPHQDDKQMMDRREKLKKNIKYLEKADKSRAK